MKTCPSKLESIGKLSGVGVNALIACASGTPIRLSRHSKSVVTVWWISAGFISMRIEALRIELTVGMRTAASSEILKPQTKERI